MSTLAVSRTRRRPLISLTPLIDVVFILLVFFMLASSFVDWRAIELSAPAETRATTGSPLQGALLVEVRPDGLRYAGEPLSLEGIVERVSQRLAQAPGTPVLVQPSAGVTLQQTVAVLDRLVDAGAASVSVVRERGR